MPEFDIFRDGRVHVISERCATCIFRPHERPVGGARVAEVVRAAKDEPGATIVCHETLNGEGNAICRGFYDRLGGNDPILRMAKAMGVIEEVAPPRTY